MLSRPKPGESEVDLLHFQNQFLATGTAPAVCLVKKGSRKSGDAHLDQRPLKDHRDVVMLDNLPDVPPALVPAPPKRARASPGCPLPEDENAEEWLNRHDEHITAVLTKIIERDTSSLTVKLPVSSGVAFPPVFHRSQERQGKPAVSGKRSIFAQEIAARRVSEARVLPAGEVVPTRDLAEGAVTYEAPTPEDQSYQLLGSGHSFQGPHLVTGKGLTGQKAEQEVQTIHKENVARLQAMSPEEILQEQQCLLAQLDPSLIAFLRSHSHTPEQVGEKTTEGQKPGGPSAEVIRKKPTMPTSASEPRKKDELEPGATALALPMTPHKEWLHMDTVELEKLHWTRDLPPLRQQQTQERMQARFSLQGELLAPDVDLPTHLGLHHHGEEAERAGYSLQELFHLTRSQLSQQRALALQVLAQIISRAQAGEFRGQLVGSVLRLLLDAGFLFLLRFSLDDRVDGVIAAAVRALQALLVAPGDEELLDSTFSWYHGASVFPLMPSQENKDDEDEDEEPPAEKAKKKSSEEGGQPPPDLARHDIIKGLLATNLLPRLRYVLEVTCPGPAVVLDLLAVLTRLARHSLESATRVLECPRLIETVVQEFLPTSWAPVGVEPIPSLHRVPCAAAMKLFRVLASAGRNIAARLLNSFDLRSRLCRFIAEAPQELSLPPEEAEMLSTEAFRLWAVAASYGQGSDLYRELYPVLVQALRAVPQELATQPPRPLAMQRIASLLTLLTRLTLATSSTNPEPLSDAAEASLSGNPSLITWTQVSGLRPLVEPCLRQTLKLLPQPETWNALGPVPTACLLFLDAYYQAWNQQPSLCPGDWLQDMECLSEELLLPLLSQPTLGRLWDSLRHCSPRCNPLFCAPAPEALPSLVALGCAGGCPPLSLAGSASPFPFLTALLSLCNTLSRIHKGLCGQLAAVLASPGLQNYILQCVAPVAAPPLTPFSAWAFRHECHLQYLAFSLAQRAAALQPVPATNATIFHGGSLALLSWLLPGSEHLAHELLLSCVFRLEFLPERTSGGPEAADFSDQLCLENHGDAGCGRGSLLAQACQDLPSIRSCYLTHCSLARASLLASQALYRGEAQRLPALLLPVPKEPLLPTDWPFLPLIHLYHRASDTPLGPPLTDTVGTAMRALQWVLVLESWRPQALGTVPPAARLARLMCVFLVDSELFRETPIQRLVAALLARLCQPQVLPYLNLDCPLPGLTSFSDLYTSFLEHFEAVSFGDHLFGALVLLPLQRRFSVTLRLALFGEHVGALRALGLPLTQLPVSLQCYTVPPEDNLALLQLYFRALVTGALCPHWCPVLYAVAVAHVNSFIFSQDPKSSDEVKAVRMSMLQKTCLLGDKGLQQHILHYKLPNSACPEGFELYPELPPLRQQHLQGLISGVLQTGEPRVSALLHRPGPQKHCDGAHADSSVAVTIGAARRQTGLLWRAPDRSQCRRVFRSDDKVSAYRAGDGTGTRNPCHGCMASSLQSSLFIRRGHQGEDASARIKSANGTRAGVKGSRKSLLALERLTPLKNTWQPIKQGARDPGAGLRVAEVPPTSSFSEYLLGLVQAASALSAHQPGHAPELASDRGDRRACALSWLLAILLSSRMSCRGGDWTSPDPSPQAGSSLSEILLELCSHQDDVDFLREAPEAGSRSEKILAMYPETCKVQSQPSPLAMQDLQQMAYNIAHGRHYWKKVTSSIGLGLGGPNHISGDLPQPNFFPKSFGLLLWKIFSPSFKLCPGYPNQEVGSTNVSSALAFASIIDHLQYYCT
ncbi:PREDICTED: RNA polymerase II-associated protein 1 [Chrysochloris asiatica]|uniref:RNA polymerase II-associated protein 1 n=1 Tax=Chrysochloris asiatica TaxID=185453 RepID=A0A9B0T5R7_CHRAS|nr:PREDICTED: RNA polymerase II-associated protein 1 [Chrysochloris asiatica]